MSKLNFKTTLKYKCTSNYTTKSKEPREVLLHVFQDGNGNEFSTTLKEPLKCEVGSEVSCDCTFVRTLKDGVWNGYLFINSVAPIKK